MVNLVNLSTDENTQLFINPDDIAFIKPHVWERHPAEIEAGLSEANIGLIIKTRRHNEEEGTRDHGLHLETALQTIEASGTKLFPFIQRWPTGPQGEVTEVTTFFVNPAAIINVLTSQSSISPGMDEQTRGVLLDIEGYGRLETTAMTEEEERTMLEAIDTRGPDLLLIGADIARARWVNAGYTLINPAKITHILQDSLQVNVFFDHLNKIDFKFDDIIAHGDDLVSIFRQAAQEDEEAAKLWQQFNAPQNDNEKFEAIRNFQDGMNGAPGRAFGETLATLAPQLHTINNARYFYALQPEDISALQIWDSEEDPLNDRDLYVRYKKILGYPDRSTLDFSLVFPNAEERARAIKALNDDKGMQPPAAPAPGL